MSGANVGAKHLQQGFPVRVEDISANALPLRVDAVIEGVMAIVSLDRFSGRLKEDEPIAIMPSRYNPDKHHRRSIRLQGYDYTAAGAYFITLCAYQRECLFGAIEDGELRLSVLGEVVRSQWLRLPKHFGAIELDEFVVMPNHVHGVFWLGGMAAEGEAFARRLTADSLRPDANASPLRVGGVRSGSVGAIVQNFKSVSTRRINQIRKMSGVPVWQRNYYEHIIRDERALQHIRHYIQNNPQSWRQDQLHPNHRSHR